MKKIPLTQDKFALVDNEDFEWLNQWKWSAHRKHTGDFVASRRCYCLFGRKRYRIFMHRQIMSCPRKLQIDHKDHNRLNNQKLNMRICTNTQNQWNRGKQKNNTSGFKGVFWRRGVKKWFAQIGFNLKPIYLGCFTSKIDAAKTYDEAAIKYFGEFAYLNF